MNTVAIDREWLNHVCFNPTKNIIDFFALEVQRQTGLESWQIEPLENFLSYLSVEAMRVSGEAAKLRSVEVLTAQKSYKAFRALVERNQIQPLLTIMIWDSERSIESLQALHIERILEGLHNLDRQKKSLILDAYNLFVAHIEVISSCDTTMLELMLKQADMVCEILEEAEVSAESGSGEMLEITFSEAKYGLERLNVIQQMLHHAKCG